MTLAALQEVFTYDELCKQALHARREWEARLCKFTTHLDERLELLLEGPLCEDFIESNELNLKASELHEQAQLALLCLERLVGRDFVLRQLADSRYADGFVAAVFEVFHSTESWLGEDSETFPVQFIAHFLGLYAFNQIIVTSTSEEYPPEETLNRSVELLSELQLGTEVYDLILPKLETCVAASELFALAPTLH